MLNLTKNRKTLRGNNPAMSFALPAGYACPGADICLAKADPKTGKITRGKNAKFLCYAAKREAIYKGLRDRVSLNFEILRACKNDVQAMATLLNALVTGYKYNFLRLHCSGDFFSKAYCLAWYAVAKANPHIIFYGYSKTIWPFELPGLNNWRFTYSAGGIYDKQAYNLGLPTCHVITPENAAALAHIDIDLSDCDDRAKLQNGRDTFGLLVH